MVCGGVPVAAARNPMWGPGFLSIGIGAGRDCDGQVLVFHDVLGIEDRITPKFVRRYADVKSVSVAGLEAYAADVRSRAFPDDTESYHLSADAAETLGLPYENIIVDTADTDTGPHCMGTFASRGTHRVGNAVIMAAQEAREVMLQVAADAEQPDGEDPMDDAELRDQL